MGRNGQPLAIFSQFRQGLAPFVGKFKFHVYASDSGERSPNVIENPLGPRPLREAAGALLAFFFCMNRPLKTQPTIDLFERLQSRMSFEPAFAGWRAIFQRFWSDSSIMISALCWIDRGGHGEPGG
jgi:hypothetical protein